MAPRPSCSLLSCSNAATRHKAYYSNGVEIWYGRWCSTHRKQLAGAGITVAEDDDFRV